MATKKDLVEAYSFSRRRLVTAFVSGAPGGREVEPARPGRSVIGGVALAVLLLAGAAIAGVFDKQPGDDWNEPGHLIVDGDTGALYVTLDDVPDSDVPRLRSVVNVTSAQLILGADVAATEVPGEFIADEPKGPAIGIVQAPATVPGVDALLNTGWTACTGTDRGVKVDLADQTRVTSAPDTGLVVRNDKQTYLIAVAPASEGVPERAYSYRFPKTRDESLYNALGVAIPDSAVEVSDEWLDLFPVGGDLDADGLDLADVGDPVDAGRGFPGKARVGDYFVSDGSAIVVTSGGVVRLSPFALAVLRNTDFGGFDPDELEVDDVALEFEEASYAAAHWPTDVLTGDPPLATDEVCAVLEPGPGQAPSVSIARSPLDSASAEGTEAGEPAVTVMSGSGAFVRSADWTTSRGGSPYLVDDRGISYPVRDDESVDNLGYGDVPAMVVPDAWIELFADGVELSRDAALCPPATKRAPKCT